MARVPKDEWIEDVETLERKMEQYVHLRERAHQAFALRREQEVKVEENRWETCARVLARRDILEALSKPW